MQTTSNAAAVDKTTDKTADKSGPAKLSEKLAEKRGALGRGLESLLPGPRVVPAPSVATREIDAGRAGAPVAPPVEAGVVDKLQAVASGRTADGETVFLVEIDLIDPNPYQTRREFNEQALAELRDSVAVQGVLQPIVVRPRVEGRFILIL